MFMLKTKAILTLIVVSICLVWIGCGFSGTWEAGSGAASVTFKSGKAYMTMLGSTEAFDYDMKGDKIVVHTKLGDIEFTKNSDGSLDGPGGKMMKK